MKVRSVFLLILVVLGAAYAADVVSYTTNPDPIWWGPDAGNTRLVDGEIGTSGDDSLQWVAYSGQPQTLVFEFDQKLTFVSLDISYGMYIGYNIVAPVVTASFSDDSIDFTDPVVCTFPDGESTAAMFERMGLENKSGKFVKLELVSSYSAGTEIRVSEIFFHSKKSEPIQVPTYIAVPVASTDDSTKLDDNYNLINGILDADFGGEDWVKYEPSGNQEIVFDLGTSQPVGFADIHYLTESLWNLRAPSFVEFSFSDDNVTFADAITSVQFSTDNGAITDNFYIDGKSGRYIKMILTPGYSGQMILGEVTFNSYDPNEVPPTEVVYNYKTNIPALHLAEDTGENELYDDDLPTDIYSSNWSDYYCPDDILEINFDFGNFDEVYTYGTVGVHYMVESAWSSFAPKQIVFTFSSDDDIYGNAVVINDIDTAPGVHTVYSPEVAGIDFKFVKVKITTANNGYIRIGEIVFAEDPYITCSSTVNSVFGHDPQRMVDGIMDNYSEYQFATVQTPIPVIFDFKELKDVSSIEVAFKGYVFYNVALDSITAEYSNDGLNFSGSYSLSNITTVDGLNIVKFDTTGFVGRYARLTFVPTATECGIGEVIFNEVGKIRYISEVDAYEDSDDGNELIDGVIASDWSETSIVRYANTNDDPNVPIIFELGEGASIDYVDVYYYARNLGGSYAAPARIDVQFSNDGINFGTVYSTTNCTNLEWQTQSARVDTTGESGKYVKVFMIMATQDLTLTEITFNSLTDLKISYTKSSEAQSVDPDINGVSLTNGYLAPDDPYDDDWSKYSATGTGTFDVIVDLAQTVTLDGIGIHYLSGNAEGYWSISAMDDATVSLSTDGVTYGSPVSFPAFMDYSNTDGFVANTNIAIFASQSVRYIKVQIISSDAFMISEITFSEAASNLPVIESAGFADVDARYSIIAVFDQELNPASIDPADFKMLGASIGSATIVSDASNCIMLTLDERMNIGDRLELQYKGIQGIASGSSLLWKRANVFYNTCVQNDAKSIIDRQLPDGAYNMYLPSDGISFQSGDSVWINPYFALKACLNLLLAYDLEGKQGYLDSVESYLQWHINHFNADGTIYDYTASYPNQTSTGDYDSTDSYAALFVVVASMYYDRTMDENDLDWLYTNVVNVASVMDMTLDTNDGLTFAKPGFSFKYLMDNCEVYMGYTLAAKMAVAKADAANEATWTAKATNVLIGIETMYVPAENTYAYAKSSNGSLSIGLDGDVYPAGDAQVFAIKHIGGQLTRDRIVAIWNTAVSTFIPGNIPAGSLDAQWAQATWLAGKYNTSYDEIAYASYQDYRYNSNFAGYLSVVYPNISIAHQASVLGDVASQDYNGDTDVNILDYSEFAAKWVYDEVTFSDLENFAENWLKMYTYTWWD